MRSLFPSPRRLACETGRKLAPTLLLVMGLALVVPLVVPGAIQLRAAEPTSAAQEGARHEGAAQEGHEPEHGERAITVVARVVNFAILAGTLVYLFRSPLATYLVDRGAGIRGDLVNAAAMKQAAAAQIEDIDRRMKTLPAELDALRAQGAQEIAAEEERIRVAAAAERDRLLDQARREIDLQVKIAERDLVAHAANLAVSVASDRIRTQITEDDRTRLVDRYAQQLKP